MTARRRCRAADACIAPPVAEYRKGQLPPIEACAEHIEAERAKAWAAGWGFDVRPLVDAGPETCDVTRAARAAAGSGRGLVPPPEEAEPPAPAPNPFFTSSTKFSLPPAYGRLDNDLDERRAKAKVIAVCVELATSADIGFDPDDPEVRAMSAHMLSWTACELRKIVLAQLGGPTIIDNL